MNLKCSTVLSTVYTAMVEDDVSLALYAALYVKNVLNKEGEIENKCKTLQSVLEPYALYHVSMAHKEFCARNPKDALVHLDKSC